MPSPPEVNIYTGAQAWEVIWKWIWFARDLWQKRFRSAKEPSQRALELILPSLGVETVLDCACGLGWKTIMIAEMGLEVEGSDRCRFSVEKARELSRDEGLDIRFFTSRWSDLAKASRRTYDCVYNDTFCMIPQRRSLVSAARSAFSVLGKRGKFIFIGDDQWSHTTSQAQRIREQWKLIEKDAILHSLEAEGTKLLALMSQKLTATGIEGNRIHIIDERGKTRIEVAAVTDPCKWGWVDFVATLKEVGFRRVYSVREKVGAGDPYTLNVAEK